MVDFRKVLDELGYLYIARNIPESEKIHEYLKSTLKERLAKETKQSGNKRVKGSAAIEGFASVERLQKILKQCMRSETLIGLIESYLHSHNLMLMIMNANNFNPTDFKPIIDDIFAAGIENHKAALTMMYTLPFNSNLFGKTTIGSNSYHKN